MNSHDLRLSSDGGLGRIWLNKPDTLNALSAETAQALSAALTKFDADPAIRVVIITGTGRGFSSGFDLDQVNTDDLPDLKALLDQHFHPLIKQIRASRLILIAAVNGPAAGAGTGLALACDLVLMADSAYFHQPFANIGLSPGAGNSIFLPQLAGRMRAGRSLYLSEKIDAITALNWGLVSDICALATLEEEALGMAETLLSKAPTSLALTKQLLSDLDQDLLARQLDREADAQVKAALSPEWVRAAKAFQKDKG